jgi:hypothetical protein
MAEKTAVDRLYEETSAVLRILEASAEMSLQVMAADHFRKALLLAAASYFEHRLTQSVLAFARQRAGGSVALESFVRNKAIARQYHTWFQWEQANANQFFALFGPSFRADMVEWVKTSDQLHSSIEAFLEIGRERNKMVHQDYATFFLSKTLDEIYGLYQTALPFVDALPAALEEFDRR